MSKIIGYIRVSTKGKLYGNHVEDQTAKIKERYSNAEIIEESYSGTKDREIFNKVVGELESGDILVITKLDRFCRNTKERLRYIDLLMVRGLASTY